MNIAQLLQRSALVHGDRPAVLAGARLLHDYRGLAARVAALAGHLRQRCGVQPGERVAIYSANCPEYLEALHAIYWCGAVSVPVNYKLHARELAHVLGDSGARVVCVSAELRDAAFAAGADPAALQVLGGPGWSQAAQGAPLAMEERTPEDLASLFYTSGTTGRPKGALLSQRMLAANADNTALSWDLSGADSSVAHAPFFHTGGLNVLTLPLLQRGGFSVLLPRFDPGQVLSAIVNWRLSVLFAVPTMFQMLADHPDFAAAELGSLRFCISGGAPCPIPLIERWAARGLTFKQGYGLTEAGVNCLTLPEAYAVSHRGSVGFANWGTQTRIVDEAGQDVAVDQVGELWLAGPTLCSGYWRRPDASAELFAGRWLKTGDLFRRDAAGFHYVVDRKKDMYISGGENVYPAEVEAAIQRLPGVRAAAVVGVADARWGEVGHAFVEMTAGLTLDIDALNAHLASCLARFKRPQRIEQLDALPLTPSGKVHKVALRARAGG